MSYAETSQHGHYVSVRDGSRSGLLLGPYPFRQDAEAHVEQVSAWVTARQPDAHFYGFGTARLTVPLGKALPPGKLNAQIGAS